MSNAPDNKRIFEEIAPEHSEILHQSSLSRSEVFVFEPTNVNEEKLGTLYIVGQIDRPQKKFLHFLNLLASVVKREYFGRAKINPVQALEYSLRQANITIAEILGEEDEDEWLENLHVVIASYADKTLHFTKVGKSRIYLLRDGHLNEVSKRLDVGEPPSPIKTFANVASGRLEEGDKVIFASPAISDLSSRIVLKKIFQQERPEMERLLREILGYLTEKTALALIVLALKKEKIEVVQNAFREPGHSDRRAGPQAGPKTKKPELKTSLDQFLYSERDEKKESASFKTPTEAGSGYENRATGEIIKKTSAALSGAAKIVRTRTQNFLKSASVWFGQIIMPAFLRMAGKIGNLLKTLSKKTRSYSFPSASSRPRLSWRWHKSGRADYLKSRPVVFIIILLLILIGAASLDEKSEMADKERYQTLLEEALRHQEAARNILVYGETEQASEIMETAQKIILEARDLGGKTEKSEADKIFADITNEWEKINNVVLVSEWETVLDASALSLLAKPASVIARGEEIYLLPKNSNLIYRYNRETKEEKFLFVNLAETFSLIDSSGLSGSLALLSSAPSMAIYDLENSLVKEYELKNISLPLGMDSYGGRLYVLDKETKQIFRIGTEGETLGVARWSSQAVPETAVDVAVDGNVNVLTSEGEIFVMSRGRHQETLKPQIRPALSHPTKLTTTDSSENFYILDNLKERLIVLTKDGQLVKQIKSGIFSAAKDVFIINDEEALILTGDKLLKISL